MILYERVFKQILRGKRREYIYNHLTQVIY